MTEAIKELWRTLAHIAPKAALFVLILTVGWLAATLIKRIVTNLLLRAGFNRLIDKAGLNKALGGNYPNELAGKLAYAAAGIFVLQLAFGVFGPNPISALITAVIAFLPRIAVALALIITATTIAAKLRDIIADALSGLNYGHILATAAKVFVIALGVIAALNQIGVALTVTMPVLIAVLATAAGVIIVGAGGGLIEPARQRWERILDKAEADTKTLTVTVERTVE